MGSFPVALPFLGLFFLYFIINYITTSVRAYKFKRSHGCQPAPRYPQRERILGLELFKTVKRSVVEKRSLDAGLERSLEIGSTYSAVSMGRLIVVTMDPDNVKAVLATNFKDYSLGERLLAFNPLLGSGIFTTDGVHWEHSRALVRPNFSKAQVADLDSLETHVQHLISKIPRDGATVDLQPLFFNQTLDSATEFLFGESVQSQTAPEGSEAHRFCEAFDYAQSQLQFRYRLGRLCVLYRNKKFSEACKRVHTFADRFVYKALEYRTEKSAAEDTGRYIFLNELAKSTSDPKQLRDELLNILLAGRDTTASLLSNTFHALARHPNVWKKLKQEVDTLEGRTPTYENLKNMQYLKFVLNEALRLFPSVPNNARFANKDTVLPRGGGSDGQSPVFIPKGTIVAYSVYSMHRRTDIYGSDAHVFRPERWASDSPSGQLRPGWGYLPFNGGPRICVGQQFALTEASYTIVRIMQTFGEIENRDPMPWIENFGITLSSSEGVQVGLL